VRAQKVYSCRISLTWSQFVCTRDVLRLCARRRGVAHPFLSAPSHGNAVEAFARTAALEHSTACSPFLLRFPQHLCPLFPARFRTRGIRRLKRPMAEMFVVIKIITQLSVLRRGSERNDQRRSPSPRLAFRRRRRRSASVQTKEMKELERGK